MLLLQGYGTSGAGFASGDFLANNTVNGFVTIGFVRDGTVISQTFYESPANGGLRFPLFQFVDAVAAGTYTYEMQIAIGGGGSVYIDYVQLVAYEI